MSSIHQRSSLALKIMMLLDHIGYFFCPQQSLSCIKGTLDLKLWNSWHRSASSAKFSAIYHPLMPSILDSPSLSIRSIYIYIILYYTHVSFNFLSLPSKWKWNSCRLCKPTLWQFPTYPNFMYAMASCIVRGFFRRAAAVKTREREREEKKTVVWCQNEDAGHMIISMQCMHFCIYLKLSFEHTMLNARNSLIHMIHTRYIYVE